MIIQPISSGHYAARREELQPYIDRAVAYSYRTEDTVEAVEAAISKLDAYPVLVEDDDQVLAMGVVEAIETKDGKFWNIWTMSGVHMHRWVPEFLSWLEGIAAKDLHGAKGVMLGGRVGWERALKDLGYEPQAVILRKRVVE